MSSDGRQTAPIAAHGLDMVSRSHRGRKNIPVHAKNPPSRASLPRDVLCYDDEKSFFFHPRRGHPWRARRAYLDVVPSPRRPPTPRNFAGLPRRHTLPGRNEVHVDTKVPIPLEACPLCASMFAIASKNGRREFVENDRFSAHQRERRTFVVERDEDRNGVGDGTILLQRIPGKHTVVPGKVTMIVLLAGSRHRQQERHRVELVLVAENVHVGENLLHAADHVLHPRRLLSGREKTIFFA